MNYQGHGVQVFQQSMQQLDKDELHVCPYDASHRIAAKRFVRHIIKCRKNHAGADKSVCPFNARHVVPKPELQLHISSCPDRRLIENEINCDRLTIDGDEARGNTSVPPYSTEEDFDFDVDEDWDREIAAIETQRPNYRTVKPSSRFVWDVRETDDRANGDNAATNHYATQSSQPFPMERRPMSHPQLRSGVVGVGRGRMRYQKTNEQQKQDSKENVPRPGPSHALLAANFNVQPREPRQTGQVTSALDQASRPSISRRPMRSPAYSQRVDQQINSGSRRSPATEPLRRY